MSAPLMMRPRRQRRPRGQRRGATTIEAILAISVFIIVWAGVSYKGRLSFVQMDQVVKARGCAWIVASSGCKNTPPECRAEERSSKGGEEQAALLSRTASAGGDESKMGSRVQNKVGNEISGLFSKRTKITAESEVDAPPLLGGAKVKLSATHQLPCNSVPKTGESLTDEIYNLVKP